MSASLFWSCSKEEVIANQDTENIDVITIERIVLRSEFEKTGDIIYDLKDDNEGLLRYSILNGNTGNHFDLNPISGEIKIKNTIQDAFNVLHKSLITISIGNTNYKLSIYDMFDYYLENLPSNAVVLQEHNEKTVDNNSDWTVFNNLWGRGDAIPNKDFRIATIHYNDIPNKTELIWDVPSNASKYNGAAVWNYNNVFWGNRKNVREDLTEFPFQIEAIKKLNVNFDFEQLHGNDQFKIAMNMFMTDESELTKFSNNDGDFFFVFDQKDTFIPKYSNTLPDIIIDGKPFAVLYDLNTSNQYERRRVIIKDNEKFMQGQLDLKALFKMFIDENFLNPKQYIYHIQFGIEVTSGFGAVRFNELHINFEKN